MSSKNIIFETKLTGESPRFRKTYGGILYVKAEVYRRAD